MLMDIYNHARCGVSRKQAVKVLNMGVEEAIKDLATDPSLRMIFTSYYLVTADGYKHYYPDLSVKYAAKFMALHPGSKGDEEVIRALHLISEFAEKAYRIDPASTREALIAAAPFAAEFRFLRIRIKYLMGTINPDPAYWAAMPGDAGPELRFA